MSHEWREAVAAGLNATRLGSLWTAGLLTALPSLAGWGHPFRN